LPEFPKAAGALQRAGGVEAWFREFNRRAQETKLKGEDHATVNALAMAAAYSPKTGEPLGFELPFDPTTARVRESVWQRWLEHDPVRFIPKSLEAFRKLKTVFVDCGLRDEFHLQFGARMVVEALRQGSVEVIHEEFEDGHMGINYRYDRSLLSIAPRF
jgi:hypothetical protein